jgi:competence protein ComEA
MMKFFQALFLGIFLLCGASGAYAFDKLDLNTATVTQLQAIKGIGPKLAGAIIKYRTEHHGFKSVDDLKSVRGVGAKNFLRFKDQVTIKSSSSKAG